MKEFIIRVIDPEEIKWYEEEPEIPELVRCKDCRKRGTVMCHLWFNSPIPKDSWYCADGERK